MKEINEQKMKEQANKHTGFTGHTSKYNDTCAWCEYECSWVVFGNTPNGTFENPRKIVNIVYALYPHYK